MTNQNETIEGIAQRATALDGQYRAAKATGADNVNELQEARQAAYQAREMAFAQDDANAAFFTKDAEEKARAHAENEAALAEQKSKADAATEAFEANPDEKSAAEKLIADQLAKNAERKAHASGADYAAAKALADRSAKRSELARLRALHNDPLDEMKARMVARAKRFQAEAQADMASLIDLAKQRNATVEQLSALEKEVGSGATVKTTSLVEILGEMGELPFSLLPHPEGVRVVVPVKTRA